VGMGGKPLFSTLRIDAAIHNAVMVLLKGRCNARGTEAAKPGRKRGARRVRVREYSIRRDFGLLRISLASGSALTGSGTSACKKLMRSMIANASVRYQASPNA
jgi:hypothetical protein